ncbi:hypothetical protein YC2023_108849 [Brassica napus]
MRSNYNRPMNMFLLKFVGLLIKLSLLMVKDCGIIEFQRFMWKSDVAYFLTCNWIPVKQKDITG